MQSHNNKNTLGLWSLLSIGIGGMVGGGLFAVLGLTALLAKGATPLAFLLAGLVALFTSYSYAKLSLTFPTQGGSVVFLNQAFGRGLFAGTLNVLLCLSYVIIIALYAVGFANYAITFSSPPHDPLSQKFIASILIISLTTLNLVSPSMVLKSELFFNIFKLTILAGFIIAGVWTVEPQRLGVSQWGNFEEILAGGMIIFLSYEGFELIANTTPFVKHSVKNIPKAFYISVIFVILLYLCIGIVAIGNLSISEFAVAKDYALAQSALPFFGKGGFILISIAAMIASASAINAALYGSAKVSYIVAKDGELPQFLDRTVVGKPMEGLLVLSLLILIVVNFFDIENISIMASAGFLLIFAAVNWAHIKLAKQTQGRKWISFAGFLSCMIACASIISYRLHTAPQKIFALLGIVLIAFLIEWIYRKLSGREIKNFHIVKINP